MEEKKMQVKLTEGKIAPQIIQITLPLVCGNILQQFYNIFDSLIIGMYLGTNAFAAVGIAGTVMNLFIFILNGFCIGISTMLSRIYGEGNREKFRKEVFAAFYFGSLVTILLSVLALGFLMSVLRLVQTPENLIPSITSYLRVILSGLIVTFFYNLCSCILRSIGNTRVALYFLALSVALNVGFDIFAIAVLRTGIYGAAVATVLAQLISAVCCLLYILHYDRTLLCYRQDIGWHVELVKETTVYAVSSALHQSSLYIGKMLVQGAVNPMGVVDIAAFTAATKIESIVFAFSNSTAEAESIFISQNYGAGKYDRVKKGFRAGRVIHTTEGILWATIMYISAYTFSEMFLAAEEMAAIDACVGYLQLLAFYLPLSFFSNSYVGLFRGVGRVSAPFWGTTIFIGIRVILTFEYVAIKGVPYIATATGVGWIVALFHNLAIYYYIMHSERYHLKDVEKHNTQVA